MAQTEIQKQGAIRHGSVIVEIGDDLSSLVNIGAIRDLSFNEQGTVAQIEFDNTLPITVTRNGDLYSFDFTMGEINWSNIALMNDGAISVVNIAGTPVSGEDQVVNAGGWSYGQLIELSGQNADGSQPTINSVTAGTDGALVLNTDYFVAKNSAGKWAVYIIDSSTLSTENQAITINTDYTPSASKRVTFSDNVIKREKYIRLTNTDANGKRLIYTLKGVTNVTPIALDFAGDQEDDVATLPVSLQGRMVDIVDEQQTT